MTAAMVDFTAFRHPVLAVACPDCRKRAGVMCVRPSGHGAADFHASRKRAADAAFVDLHGEDAWIEREPDNGWTVHAAGGTSLRAAAAAEQPRRPRAAKEHGPEGQQLRLDL